MSARRRLDPERADLGGCSLEEELPVAGHELALLRRTQRAIESRRAAVLIDKRHPHGERSRLELAVSLCSDPVLDVLFTSESTLDELPEVMRRLSAPDSGALCHRVRYG